MVTKFWQLLLPPQTPGEVVVVGDVTHVVSVNRSERCKSVTNDGEKSDQHIIDDIGDVGFSISNVNPSWISLSATTRSLDEHTHTNQEQYPSQTKQCDQSRIQCDKESKGYAMVSKCV